MSYPIITACPVCSHTMKITKLHCTNCHTTIENEFQLSKLASLRKDQYDFIEVFLKCRGNIKEVEKEMGISYPTVRGKLNDVVAALGYAEKKAEPDEKKIVSLLEKGEITTAEALKMLKGE